jgi:hypothetical protein
VLRREAEDEYYLGPESYLGADGVGGGTTDTRICKEFSTGGTGGAAIGIT